MRTAAQTHAPGSAALITHLLALPGVALAARIALCSAFLVSGIVKLLDFPGAVVEVRGLTGAEPAILIAALVIAVQLGGSALVVAGGRLTWLGAGLLAGFTVAATLLGHAFWLKSGADRTHDLNTFFEHLGLVGGFALAAILANGRPRGVPE
jgi:transmembrane protein